MSIKQNRIDYIDVFRAFGILLMIMGHVYFGSLFDKWIHVFHMPMFFFISGYFFKDEKFFALIKKRSKTLLLPYAIFGIFHILIYFISIGRVDMHAFYLFFINNVAESGIPIAGALWFLTAMFFSEIIYWFVNHFSHSDIFKLILSLFVATLGMIFATYLPFRLPLALDAGMVGVGLYQFGNLIKNRFNKVLELNIFISIVGIVVFSILGFVNEFVNLRIGLYGIWPLFWIDSIGLTISFWNLFRIMTNFIEKKKVLNKVFEWIKSIGHYSILYLCLNQIVILFVSYIVGFFSIPDNTLVLLAKRLCVLSLSLIFLQLLKVFITRTRLRYIIGR